jgi:putative NIF3 family GTP cyclohydrolase 1 type 2
MKLTRVALVAGAAGAEAQIRTLQRDDVELLLIGETTEWETIPYVRDAVAQGRHKALILLGHVPSEEPGMENCARWLRTFITEVPVEFVPAGEPFWEPK